MKWHLTRLTLGSASAEPEPGWSDMLRTRQTWRQRLMRGLAVGAMLAGAAGALAPPAAAGTTCTFNPPTMHVEVQGDPDPSPEGLATIQRSGIFITVNGQLCGLATVLTTDTIQVVTGSPPEPPGHERVVLYPGLASFDILVEVDLAENPSTSPQSVRLVGTNGPDVMTVGDLGADQDGDGDVDVTITDTAIWLLETGAGNDTVTGQGGAGTGGPTQRRMVIVGGPGEDTLIGGSASSDHLWGGPGNDDLDGGVGGADTARYDFAPSRVTVDLAAGTATGGDGVDTLIGIEYAIGSDFDDEFLGDDGNNSFEGRGGCDEINGGDGIDRVSYNNSPGPVEVDLSLESASAPGCDDPESFSNIEGAAGSHFDDTLIGDDGPNSLSGLGGIDVIVGLGGNDTLNGGVGNDALSGGPGDDRIWPGPGNDVAHGGSGVDLLTYAHLGAGVIVDLLAQTTDEADGSSDAVAGIENVQGSPFDDILIGDAGDNQLDGGDGYDICDPGLGNDPPPVNCEE